MAYENRVATMRAINKMVIPIDRGLIIRNIFIDRDRIIRVRRRVIININDFIKILNGLYVKYIFI